MRNLLLGIGIAVILGIALIVFLNQVKATNQTMEEDVGFSQDEVESGINVQENGANGHYVVNLLSGSFEGEVEGIVRSDTDCTADEEGISRCHNDIQLNDKEKISIVNPHNMQNNRCLKPGETVRLSKNQDGKVVVDLTEL